VTISGKPVQYKGDDLDPERGPGLGCFRFQLVVLVVLVVLTPLSVVWQWPDAVSAGFLFTVIILLLVTGQTIIFLLRLVAADRRGRDSFFKFYMRTLFARQVREYEAKYGIRFLGWYNVAHGWDFDNVILLDLPDYATLDKLEADESLRALGHRAGEWIFQRHHSMFLRERMGPDLEYHG
jgi:hypothetical protein